MAYASALQPGDKSILKLALANLEMVNDLRKSTKACLDAITLAAARGAELIAFPECFLPGYRDSTRPFPRSQPAKLRSAWTRIAARARDRGIAVVLGTERYSPTGLRATALVIDSTGAILGFQDKVQLDPSEDGIYEPGDQRQTFLVDGRKIGIVICHEGWRYPETVRWLANQGARLVLHLQFHGPISEDPRPLAYGALAGSFHETAVLCRAAENEIWFASVNSASENSATTSAIADPEGRLVAFHPYDASGLLYRTLDLERARASFARRLRPIDSTGQCARLVSSSEPAEAS
jgi:predicted amidohydrolase